MGEQIERPEYEEALKRLEAEDSRQNHRLEKLETVTDQINTLAASVSKLAANVETMTKELTAQSKRLESLESRDGEMWREVVKYIVAGVVGAVIGYAFKAIGIF